MLYSKGADTWAPTRPHIGTPAGRGDVGTVSGEDVETAGRRDERTGG